MALKDIKNKIQATNRMHTVTRAMEAVSAVKMRKSQQEAFLGRPYAFGTLSVMESVTHAQEDNSHTLMQPRPVSRIACVVITSDKGLAGGLNTALLKKTLAHIETFNKDAIEIYAFGKKGEDFFRTRGYAIKRGVLNKGDSINQAFMKELADELLNKYIEKSVDSVVVSYTNFKSTFEQEPTIRTLVPITEEALRTLIDDITPTHGKWEKNKGSQIKGKYLMEPSAYEVLNLLLPRVVRVSLYHMLLESKASEHSARMVAMKNASDKSKEVERTLKRQYNKIRQSAITREVSEIVSGREALSVH